jgi:uncharacterized protein (TIGR03000 family)
MSRRQLAALATLVAAALLGPGRPYVHGHGGGHGGPGGYGGYGGYGFHGYHGFGYGGYGYGGYGYRGFGYGYPGFGYGGFGYGPGYGLGYGLGYGGLGYGRFGYGGWYPGYGGYGYGGYGYGGGCSAYGGYGGLGYSGISGGLAPIPYGLVPTSGITTDPGTSVGGSSLLVSRTGGGSRYVDYYDRGPALPQPSLIASGTPPAAGPYIDYYAHNSRPQAPAGIERDSRIQTVALRPDNKARVRVRLPAQASLWVNGQSLDATGPEREYVSARLPADEVRTVRLKASWSENGRVFEESIDARIRANQTTQVTFGTAVATGDSR